MGGKVHKPSGGSGDPAGVATLVGAQADCSGDSGLKPWWVL